MPYRVSRHQFNYRWYNPLPRELWESHACTHCENRVARWFKESRRPLQIVHEGIEWPTEPSSAPNLLCDDCYSSYCGGVTDSGRRVYNVDQHGTPELNGERYSNHIKRRLP